MPKSIFDYVPDEEKISKAESKAPQDAEKLIEHYKGFSQDELIKELFRVASSEKEKGTITKEKLQEIRLTIVPYLNDNQIEFLDKLIERLDV